MKKILILLAVLLTLSATAFASTPVTTVQALGIMNGDEYGNMNLTEPVTRAEFAKMLVSASSEKNSNQTAGSVFSDVKADHWASPYVRVAVNNGWVSGYTDGSYRPESSIRAEEAYAMVLRLLGYDTTALNGNFTTAILDLANQVDLNDDITNTDIFLREDCAILFTNAMTTLTPAGQYYGATLGYTVTAGELDISAITTTELQGPYIYDGSVLDTTPEAVYRDDVAVSLDQLQVQDVYYLNKNTNTLYAYSTRVYGTITAIQGTLTAPTAVTIQGVPYTLGTNDVKLKLTTGGSIAEGSMVTLLLGMDGTVADIVEGVGESFHYYGVVTATTPSELGTELTVACTDGVSRTFDTSATNFSTTDCVDVTIASQVSVKTITSRSLYGTVKNSKLGGYSFAENVEILDVYNSSYKKIYASQLDGYTLTSSDVKFYTLDDNGDISHLILDNATGDLMSYAYLESSQSVTTTGYLTGVYTVNVGSGSTTIQSSGRVFSVSRGGVCMGYDSDYTLTTLKNITKISLDDVTGLTAIGNGKTYQLAEDALILVDGADDYVSIALSDLNIDNYSITGYQDTYSAGQKIRLLILDPV